MYGELAEILWKEVTRDMPVHVAVNKCESEKTGALNVVEFWSSRLGEFWSSRLGDPFPVLIFHGVGTVHLLETVEETFEKAIAAVDDIGY